MTARITIMIDADLLKKLRLRQANLLKKSTKSISLSSVIDQVLRKALWDQSIEFAMIVLGLNA